MFRQCTCCRILALIVIAAAAWAIWWLCTPTLVHSEGSPRGVYRMDSYAPSPLQQVIHANYKQPGFVRLYRVNPDLKLLGESKVVDMDYGQGEVIWGVEYGHGVSVGRDIQFKNLTPECNPTCPQWPLPQPHAQALKP